jgi:type IV secretion system protein VirB10
MTLKILLAGAMIAAGSATLLAQDEPQLTPRTAPKTQASAQAAPNAVAPDQRTPQLTPGGSVASQQSSDAITVPSGTRIPLTLKQGITTKNARVGDPVYAQTSFPITQNDHIVIPPGTFVQGEIRRVQRPGRVKGRAELLMNFTSMIFPNGYTIVLPGAVQGTPGDPGTNGVKDKEGTIAGDSSKAKDVGTIVGTAIPGAGIGAIADQGSGKGAAIGAASGGALGLATVLLTRGPEIQLGVGQSVEMVLERSLTIEPAKVNRAAQ